MPIAHPNFTEIIIRSLKQFLRNGSISEVIESIIKSDEAVFQQHASNLEKISKFMSNAEGCNVNQTTIPGLDVINDATTLLREVSSYTVTI